MQTLDEFNAERREAYRIEREHVNPCPNGIECPKCETELWDSSPIKLLTSLPPKKNVHCPKCGYMGYRIA